MALAVLCVTAIFAAPAARADAVSEPGPITLTGTSGTLKLGHMVVPLVTREDRPVSMSGHIEADGALALTDVAFPSIVHESLGPVALTFWPAT